MKTTHVVLVCLGLFLLGASKSGTMLVDTVGLAIASLFER